MHEMIKLKRLYVDKELYRILQEKAVKKGISISDYLTLLVQNAQSCHKEVSSQNQKNS